MVMAVVDECTKLHSPQPRRGARAELGSVFRGYDVSNTITAASPNQGITQEQV